MDKKSVTAGLKIQFTIKIKGQNYFISRVGPKFGLSKATTN